MSNLASSYTKVLGVLHELEPQDNFLKQRRLPELTDKQLIALALRRKAWGSIPNATCSSSCRQDWQAGLTVLSLTDGGGNYE